MSFQDLERGSSSRPAGAASRTLGAANGAGGNTNGTGSSIGGSKGSSTLPLYHAPPSAVTEEEREFKKLADRMGIQIFKINSNVAAIEKLVQISKRDDGKAKAQQSGQQDWAQRVHDLHETTRALVKDSTGDIKTLTKLAGSLPAGTASQQAKLSLAKLQRDFEASLKGFQGAQRLSAERNRDALEGAKRDARAAAAKEGGAGAGAGAPVRSLGKQAGKDAANAAALESDAVDTLVDTREDPTLEAGQEQAQVQVQKPKGPSQSEIEFQEALIAEREAEIEEIETGIHELNEIFRDLGHIVQEQGGMIDNIEYNVTSIAANTQGADRELVTAHEYQRKAGRRAACLLLIVGVVVTIVLLALLS